MNIERDPQTLVAPLDQLNFLHEAKQYIDKNLTSTQAYYLMTSKPPVWLRAAFKLRDFLSRHLGGVQPIQGFGESTKPLQVGGKADFFDVVKVSDRELFLQSTDKHLSVLLALQIEEYDELRNELTICTSVVTYNLFGKIYMLPVSLVHGFIVQQSLKNLQIKS